VTFCHVFYNIKSAEEFSAFLDHICDKVASGNKMQWQKKCNGAKVNKKIFCQYFFKQKVFKKVKKVVKKLSKNVKSFPKWIKKLSKSCQKAVKKLSKVVKKCQKIVKQLSKLCQNFVTLGRGPVRLWWCGGEEAEDWWLLDQM
jgi:tRNA-dihydrouridine synthase